MSEDHSIVEYRDLTILGFPGYRVGNDGSVWSCLKRQKGTGHRYVLSDTWKRLQPQLRGKSGYRIVTLKNKNQTFSYKLVHRLVLEVFVGPCPEGMECCHFPDRDPANNKLSNLRWDTYKGNAADSINLGTFVKGERHGKAKFTEKQVAQIRAEYNAGNITMAQLAQNHNSHHSTIWNIIHRRTWTHI